MLKSVRILLDFFCNSGLTFPQGILLQKPQSLKEYVDLSGNTRDSKEGIHSHHSK